MATISRINICNEALDEIRADNIQSVDENSLSGKQCRRHYPNVIAEMLEGPHDWSFANRRQQLVRFGNNGRSNEWLYAYQLPGDFATAIRVIPDLSALGLGIPVGWTSQPYYESWASYASSYETPYLIENDVLYSNEADAFLEYGINSVEEVRLTEIVRRAIALELASRLAFPIKQDARLKAEMIQLAEVQWARAIADDLNRHPRQEPAYDSPSLRARRGYGMVA